MTFTAQISPFTCSLACLESFYRDNGKPITQQSLLHEHPEKCSVGALVNGQDASGALTLPEFLDLCVHLGLKTSVAQDFPPDAVFPLLRGLQRSEAVVFFVVHFGGGGGPTHYVGFSRLIEPDIVEVMNPSGNPQFIPVKCSDLVAWGLVLVRIKLPDAP